MDKKIENHLTEVPETMLITLWAKAMETGRPDALLHDEKAVEILRHIDYDFTKFKNAKFSQAGCCVRASLIDKAAKTFINRHPDAVVVQLGAGIDARYERLGYPAVTHWYDLDLPQAIELRRKFLKETDRNTYIESSMFDYGWIESVKAHQKPVLIIIEGILMYFAPDEVKSFFEELCRQFDNATVIFDMLAFSLVGHAKDHDSLRKVDDVEFRWSLLDTKDMEKWNPKIHLKTEYYMSDYENGRYPFVFRTLYKLKYFYRRFNQRVVILRIKNRTDSPDKNE